MKRFKLLFIAIFALLDIPLAIADDSGDVARAATRRDATNTVTASNRQSSSVSYSTQNTSNVASRSTSNISTGNSQQTNVIRDRAAVQRGSNNAVVSSRQAVNQSVTARTASPTVLSRTVQAPNNASKSSNTTRTVTSVQRPSMRSATSTSSAPVATARTGATTISRTATISRAGALPATSAVSSARSATRPSTTKLARTATTLTAQDIMNRDTSQCKQVFYDCMDEFCANKDSQLRRCACSARVNEFDDVKNRLAKVEDKLLDFNQRLLTVNMDKEDAEALSQATEGELAFQQEDKSESKKMLDEIAEKLNSTFESSTLEKGLGAINLSLNADTAFDNIDSLMGVQTTTKTGTALYNDALPICREMALEICSENELSIIESAYQMSIEQDCNTVAKTYSSQEELARQKILEGSALLDMSRLDTYQKRNSDDILTCKKKMLETLTSSSVCGKNLEKCLDTTGQYIDPSTGEAFLTANLADLNYLITRPEAEQTWTDAPGNEKFVTFLMNKKTYLESATENCQDIADYVWDEFLEDALAQIKLAQESKLEEVRQSCTTLTTQCLSNTYDSIEEFDSRALSTFGVIADKTVNALCADVKNACTALLNTTGGGDDWIGGMGQITTDKTYETIMSTCREVGRSCIIQTCQSANGKFALCNNSQLSINRKSIINRSACWQEVRDCIAESGRDSIINIIKRLTNQNTNPAATDISEVIYKKYGEIATESCTTTKEGANKCVYDFCATECGVGSEYSYDCYLCKMTENIWGNCEAAPSTELIGEEQHNMIRIPADASSETLLSWFAKNTGSEKDLDSCLDTTCPAGQVAYNNNGTILCVNQDEILMGEYCPTGSNTFSPIDNNKNCCSGGSILEKKCCSLKNHATSVIGLNLSASNAYFNTNDQLSVDELKHCLPAGTTFVTAFTVNNDNADKYYGTGINFLLCTGPVTWEVNQIKCDGQYIVIKSNDYKIIPAYGTKDNILKQINQNAVVNTYRGSTESDAYCRYTFNGQAWEWAPSKEGSSTCFKDKAPKNWKITYPKNN